MTVPGFLMEHLGKVIVVDSLPHTQEMTVMTVQEYPTERLGKVIVVV
jgi:hypothetical protein